MRTGDECVRTSRRRAASSDQIFECGELRVEVCERAIQLFPVARGLAALQIFLYARAGKEKHFPAAV